MNASMQFSARQRELLRRHEVECTSDVVMVSRDGAAVHDFYCSYQSQPTDKLGEQAVADLKVAKGVDRS